jgi:hypothetical protein
MATSVGISRLRSPTGPAIALDTTTKGYVDALATQGSGVGKVRPTPVPAAIGVDANYAAFPGVAWYPDTAQLRMVWRQGTDHSTARDGVIKTSVSNDLGRTWATATTALSDGAAPDLRDPSISTSTDLTTTYLTYFKGSVSLAAAGCFLRTSTDRGASWGSEVRIDPTQPYAAITAPVRQLADGSLAAVYYGKSGADTFDSCWYATSATGASWSVTRVANGQTASTNYQEPWLVISGSTFLIFYRHGSSSIGVLKSTNSGSSWTSPAASISSATGRPSAAWMTSGTIALQYRRTTDGACCLRTSKTGLVNTWNPETIMFTGAQALTMDYCCPVEISPGSAYCPSGKELSSSSAKVYSIYLTEGAGTSPLGDSVPGGNASVASDIDFIAFADIFHYPNGSLPAPWTTGAGTVTVTEGNLVSGAADNSPDYALVTTTLADAWIEADLMWSGSQAGFGIIFHWVDSSNFLYYTAETGGTALRLYKVVAGTPTVLAGPATDALNASVWHRLAVSARSNRIQCFANGVNVLSYTLTGGEQTSFGTSLVHGVKLNPASGGQHSCRRFLIRS